MSTRAFDLCLGGLGGFLLNKCLWVCLSKASLGVTLGVSLEVFCGHVFRGMSLGIIFEVSFGDVFTVVLVMSSRITLGTSLKQIWGGRVQRDLFWDGWLCLLGHPFETPFGQPIGYMEL